MYDAPVDTVDSSGNIIGNYATWRSGSTVSEGNLTLFGTGASSSATLAPTTGKWYAEFTCIYGTVGDSNTFYINGGNIALYGTSGNAYINSAWTAYGSSYTTGDIIGCAVDMDAGSVTFYKNGVAQPTFYGNPNGALVFGSTNSGANSNSGYYANFGQQGFTYTPPTGFKALNTKNLKDVGSYNLPDTFGNFVNTPDLVWIKSRSGAYDHRIFDTVRGPQRGLVVGTTGAESAEINGVQSFNPNGVVVGAAQDWNSSGATYVSWMWNRGKTPGFDIVTYTGNGLAQTIPHNLGQTPAFMAVKNYTNGTNSNWMVYHKSVGATVAGNFNGVGTFGASTSYFNDTAPGPTNFTVGNNANTSTSGISYIAYLWAEVPGFSKMGFYTGNGSTNGPFVYTGFKPKFVLVKCSSNTTSSTIWNIWDTARSPSNPCLNELYFPTAPAENVDSSGGDLLSNGFKPKRNSEYANLSGWTYVYMAFAETPFKYANAR